MSKNSAETPWTLITGASSGIGYEIALEHARRNWNLILISRKEADLQKAREEALKINSRIQVECWAADVSQSDFEELLKSRLKSKGPLKMVYVNAGIGAAGSFEKLSMADFDRCWNVNVRGALQTIYGCLQAVKKAEGRFVLLGSLNSFLALPLGAPYNVSKFAIRALAQTLDAEWANSGPGLTVVYPGPVRTNIVALDNEGNFVPEAKASFENKPALAANIAAQRIVRGALNGRRSFSLQWTSSLLIGFQQRFPNFTGLLLRFVYGRFENSFRKLVGLVNPKSV